MGIEVNKFAYIRLILKAKFGDDPWSGLFGFERQNYIYI